MFPVVDRVYFFVSELLAEVVFKLRVAQPELSSSIIFVSALKINLNVSLAKIKHYINQNAIKKLSFVIKIDRKNIIKI